MKYLNIYLILLVFCFTACQKNEDLTETVKDFSLSELVPTSNLTLTGGVGEYGSYLHWTNRNFRLQNVKIQLMYNDEVLDETNTDEVGTFSFPTQPVPNEGAYLLFESPGFYNNVSKVDTFSTSIFGANMLRKSYPNLSGEAISNGGPYIKLKGVLQDPSEANIPLYYITNSADELIGTTTPVDDFNAFTITTLANEELFLHYKVDCHPEGVIPLGSFSEDTDIGVLLDQSFDFSKNLRGLFISNVYDCLGANLSEYSIFFNLDGLTEHSWGTSGFGAWECDLLVHPVIVTVATQSPRRYQEKIVDFSQPLGNLFDMTLCTEDDTYIKYTIGGGAEIDPNLFTYANILPNGQLLLKQKDPDYDNGTDITFFASGSNVGSSPTDVVFYSGLEILLGGYGLTMNVTSNDGEFIEGTFSGEALDAFESSLGNLEGSFRARIQ